MRTRKSTLRLNLAVVAAAAIMTATAPAQTEKVLYSFQNNDRDGYNPYTGVIFDAAGNLYGTTGDGGSNHNCVPEAGCGTVFALTKNTSGGWTEETLHQFNDNGKDGFFPEGGLTFDAAGNLYGTTVQGGSYQFASGPGGTSFELSPTAGGGWTEKILHSFGKAPDGAGPEGGLVLDNAGNLYGTTFGGGTWLIGANGGTVFELSPKAGGGWSEKILHHFGSGDRDGFGPTGHLTIDAAGNLYGTTVATNEPGYCPYKDNCGVVFELSPQADGTWTETILHTFQNNGTDGVEPYGGVILDAEGNLYGTTAYGGPNTDCQGYSCGTVFELSPQPDGAWRETILHAFSDNGTDGYFPALEKLLMDGAGNLYGTTLQGGTGQSGILYKLAPQADGNWTETTVREFGQVGFFADGFGAEGTLIMDASGNIYGTALGGGFNECVNGCGLVFEITP
jgi:uncharacterized repeat protein (TIGR03803 family)